MGESTMGGSTMGGSTMGDSTMGGSTMGGSTVSSVLSPILRATGRNSTRSIYGSVSVCVCVPSTYQS